MRVVAREQAHRHHEVVDVAEDKGVLAGVAGAVAEEGGGVVAPVAEGVEVVGCVVAVVVAVAVGLLKGGVGLSRGSVSLSVSLFLFFFSFFFVFSFLFFLDSFCDFSSGTCSETAETGARENSQRHQSA